MSLIRLTFSPEAGARRRHAAAGEARAGETADFSVAAVRLYSVPASDSAYWNPAEAPKDIVKCRVVML